MVVGVCGDLYREVGRLALLKDLYVCELTDAMLEEALKGRGIFNRL